MTPGTVNPLGFAGGGQIGYNIQYGIVVFGLEADAEWLEGSADRSVTGFAAGLGKAVFETTPQSNWLATVRGRVGAGFGNTLWYITGGGAAAGIYFNDSFTGSSGIATNNTNSRLSGWALWVLLNNWIVRGEYLYVDLTPSNQSIPSCGACVTGSDITVTHKYIESIARFGVSYKIGAWY